MSVAIPSSHIYDKKQVSDVLSQGDVIYLGKELKKEFLKHFQFDFDPEYLIVMNQSCDLVRRKNKTPKIKHIVLSLIRPFKNYLARTVKDLGCKNVDENITLIKDNDYNLLRQKVFDLVNNANAKAHMFLPKKSPFTEHMITIFNTVYPLRFDEQYDILLKNRVLSVNNEYKAKIGDIFSTLFGRVVVTELVDIDGWDKNKLYSTIDKMFDEYGLIKADRKVIEKLLTVGKVTKVTAKQKVVELAMEIKEEEASHQLKNALDKLKPGIIKLIVDCMDNDDLRVLSHDQLRNKISKLFDKNVYINHDNKN